VIILKNIICNDTKEIFNTKKKEYDKYLNSNHWKKLRLRIAQERNYRCEVCDKMIRKRYHIHHLTYDNIGNEKDEDLMFLCEKCHNEIHKGKIERSKTKKEQQAKTKKLSIPKNYIESSNYKAKNQMSKLKYLCNCLNNHKMFSDEDRNNIIKYIENIIIEKRER
jgi:hypothetical protein